MRAGSGGQMAPGGEPQDANAIFGDAELLRTGAYHTNGTLRIAEFHWMVVARPEAILEHERGDAERVEPVGDLAAFVVVGQPAIAAAGTDDDGRGNGIAPGKEDGQGGAVAVFVAKGAGRISGPEGHGLRGGALVQGLRGEGGKRDEDERR